LRRAASPSAAGSLAKRRYLPAMSRAKPRHLLRPDRERQREGPPYLASPDLPDNIRSISWRAMVTVADRECTIHVEFQCLLQVDSGRSASKIFYAETFATTIRCRFPRRTDLGGTGFSTEN
jgi:hypothetical protein